MSLFHRTYKDAERELPRIQKLNQGTDMEFEVQQFVNGTYGVMPKTQMKAKANDQRKSHRLLSDADITEAIIRLTHI